MIPAPATSAAGRAWSRLDATAGGLTGDLLLYALATGFAAVTALASTLAPHRAWGAVAAYGYAAALLATVAQLLLRRHAPDSPLAGAPARAALTGLTWLLTTVIPLVRQAAERAAGRSDRAQEEVL
ncbi:MAG TPA: hypothetical protein VF755_20150, partial [Catenuloplanes sp.]